MRILKLHIHADYTDFALKYANFETTNPCRWLFLLWDIQTFQMFQTSTLKYANIKVIYSCRWLFLLWDTRTLKLLIPADGCFYFEICKYQSYLSLPVKLPIPASKVTNPCLKSYQSLPVNLWKPLCLSGFERGLYIIYILHILFYLSKMDW